MPNQWLLEKICKKKQKKEKRRTRKCSWKKKKMEKKKENEGQYEYFYFQWLLSLGRIHVFFFFVLFFCWNCFTANFVDQFDMRKNFIAYFSSKVSDCIFEIHQRVYSNCCCNCSFEREIIKIGQSSYMMYSNNIVNFQESTTILNVYSKNAWKLIVCTW